MPKCYQLIGVPAAGKSTWVHSQDWTSKCFYISTDKWVDIFAKEVNQTYNQVFDTVMETAVELMSKEVKIAQSKGADIIWDQTNISVKSRAKKFLMLPEYEHIAVVFKTPEPDEHATRLARPGKSIPDAVLKSMIKNFEMPTLGEGFSQIWHAA